MITGRCRGWGLEAESEAGPSLVSKRGHETWAEMEQPMVNCLDFNLIGNYSRI